jgi:predicted nuclease of predicted toxin-antitoxin system
MDEHIDPGIIRGLKRIFPTLDIQTVQQVNLQSQPDHLILSYAANENRIMVSRDRSTMSHEAIQRINSNQIMPGLILIRPRVSLGDVIESLELLVVCSDTEEMQNQILYIPI